MRSSCYTCWIPRLLSTSGNKATAKPNIPNSPKSWLRPFPRTERCPQVQPTLKSSPRQGSEGSLAPKRTPKDLLFRILKPLRAQYLGTWGALRDVGPGRFISCSTPEASISVARARQSLASGRKLHFRTQ